jgi:hypothetical protein
MQGTEQAMNTGSFAERALPGCSAWRCERPTDHRSLSGCMTRQAKQASNQIEASISLGRQFNFIY